LPTAGGAQKGKAREGKLDTGGYGKGTGSCHAPSTICFIKSKCSLLRRKKRTSGDAEGATKKENNSNCDSSTKIYHGNPIEADEVGGRIEAETLVEGEKDANGDKVARRQGGGDVRTSRPIKSIRKREVSFAVTVTWKQIGTYVGV